MPDILIAYSTMELVPIVAYTWIGEVPKMPSVLNPDRAETKTRFDRLVREWKAFETPSSSVMDLAMHPAYQQIIGIGPTAIPWIIEELEKEPDHWFWALYCLTGGVDPVPASNRGNLDAMAAAWVNWFRENGDPSGDESDRRDRGDYPRNRN